MTMPAADDIANVPIEGSPEGTADRGVALPVLDTGRSPDQVMSALRTMAQKGKAPGFEVRPGGFRLRAFGDPFDHWLDARVESAGSGSRVHLKLTVAARLPAIFLLVSVLTVQPGMWLTDSMLRTYSAWYGAHVQTWWWYVPLVIAPMPYMIWRMWRRSRVAARDHASELVERLRTALEASVASGGTAA